MMLLQKSGWKPPPGSRVLHPQHLESRGNTRSTLPLANTGQSGTPVLKHGACRGWFFASLAPRADPQPSGWETL
jgi:hypothetical protein